MKDAATEYLTVSANLSVHLWHLTRSLLENHTLKLHVILKVPLLLQQVGDDDKKCNKGEKETSLPCNWELEAA